MFKTGGNLRGLNVETGHRIVVILGVSALETLEIHDNLMILKLELGSFEFDMLRIGHEATIQLYGIS